MANWKWAPLTREMYDRYAEYSFSMLLLASSRGRGHFTIASNDAFLYAVLASVHIGCRIEAVGQVLDFHYMPPLEQVRGLEFRERVAMGFGMAMKSGIDITGGWLV